MTRTPRPSLGEDRPGASTPRIEIVADNVRRFAADRGLPVAHLADHAGIGQAAMWRILNPRGKAASSPRLSTLEALADAVGVDVIDLLRPAPEPAS